MVLAVNTLSKVEKFGINYIGNRRIRSDLIETYKIMTRVYNIPKYIFECDNKCGLRGHEHKLFTKRFRLDI